MHRKVEVLADLRQVANRRNQPRRHVARMRAGKPDPRDALDFVDLLQQRREVTGGVVGRLIVIDDLPQELDFPQAPGGGVAHFGQDLGLRPHPLVAPRVRDHAEAAVLVAAFDDRHPRTHRVIAPRDAERERDVVVRAEVDLGHVRACGLLHQHRQHPQAPRADHDIDHRRALEQRLPFLLRHAPGHHDHRVAGGVVRLDAQLPQTRVQLVLGVLAHAARVDDDDIGVAVVGRAVVPGGIQQPGHLLRVVIVHLAAVGFDEVLAAHVRPFALRLSLSPFGFDSPFARRRSSSISPALASTRSVTDCPAIIRASSCRRPVRVQTFDVGHGALTAHRLADAVVLIGGCGDLRQMGDAQDLGVGGQALQPASDDVSRMTADAGIDLVEDERRALPRSACEGLDGQHESRQLAARHDAGERPQVLARVR